ncbi:UrcA family protein [Rhizorhabdus argentea]|uniref:UrcA family protein n=1 Tax=Rhizorhabdus argentea TaxID=1387174 RepID=UPI0030EC8BBB
MTRSTAFFAALAAATAAITSFPAQAAEMINTNAEVRYGDLDLASPAGAQALRARVVRAAKRVCSIDGDRSLKALSRSQSCTRVAIARAMPQVELALANAGTQIAENSRMNVAAH